MTPQNMEKQLDDLLDVAILGWSKQGRSEDEIFGVKNFMTGLGEKMLQETFQAGEREMLVKVSDAITERRYALEREGRLANDDSDRVKIYERILETGKIHERIVALTPKEE